MTSFVAEIVRCAEKVELDDLNKNIADLSRSVFNLKCEVAKEMENTYVSFLKMPAENKKLVSEVKEQSARMEILQERVDKMVKHELESSTGELHTLSTKLMEVGLQLGHVTQLAMMDNTLQAATNALEAQEFPQAAKHIQHLLHLLDDIPPESASLKIYTSLRSEARLVQERLLYDLKEVWKAGLRWEEPEPDIEGLGLKDSMTKKKKPHRAALHVDTSCLNKLEGVFIALTVLGNFDYHVSKFASNFMRLVLQPLTTQEGQVNVLQVTDNNSEALLEIETHPNKTQPSYMSVLQNLRKVFEFTRQYLVLQVEEARDGEPLVTLVHRMGAVIGAQLCEMLVTGCLAHTVPAYGHDLNTFRQAAAEAEAFHHELKSIGFLPEENESLVKYAANIDVLFANKVCELHLHTAREIARKDLHDTMNVGIIEKRSSQRTPAHPSISAPVSPARSGSPTPRTSPPPDTFVGHSRHTQTDAAMSSVATTQKSVDATQLLSLAVQVLDLQNRALKQILQQRSCEQKFDLAKAWDWLEGQLHSPQAGTRDKVEIRYLSIIRPFFEKLKDADQRFIHERVKLMVIALHRGWRVAAANAAERNLFGIILREPPPPRTQGHVVAANAVEQNLFGITLREPTPPHIQGRVAAANYVEQNLFGITLREPPPRRTQGRGWPFQHSRAVTRSVARTATVRPSRQ